MTPADKRVMDLLDRWLASIELHLKYADLDDVSYQQMQPWPKHERPARWILELAQQKVLSLQSLCKTHRNDDDPSFAESLELMCFLSNLVGAQHIQRFIPLASPDRETKPDTGMHRALQTGSMAARPTSTSAAVRTPAVTREPAPDTGMHRALQTGSMAARPIANTSASAPAATVAAATPPTLQPVPSSAVPAASHKTTAPIELRPAVKPSAPQPTAAPVIPINAAQAPQKAAEESDHTREMPRLRPARQRHHAAPKVEPRRIHIKESQAAAPQQPADNRQHDDVVIADAIRLLKWGRQWHEIAELIARMAERPGIAEVRKILRSHKPSIEQQLEA
jgi:hypothetical protein